MIQQITVSAPLAPREPRWKEALNATRYDLPAGERMTLTKLSKTWYIRPLTCP